MSLVNLILSCRGKPTSSGRGGRLGFHYPSFAQMSPLFTWAQKTQGICTYLEGCQDGKYNGIQVKSEFAVPSYEKDCFSPLGLIFTKSLRLTQSHMVGESTPKEQVMCCLFCPLGLLKETVVFEFKGRKKQAFG